MSSPMISVGNAPKRAIKSEPGTAASANSTSGNPDRMPTWVSVRCRSSWISRITGGTARMVSRRLIPASHSNATEVTSRANGVAPRAACASGI